MTRSRALASLLIIALAGCGAGADKAGGRRSARPHVLTLANGNGNVATLQVFADEVARLSHGRLRIAFRNGWRRGRTDYETELIRDVERGRADLGWTGTRAWDSVGVSSFDALHMPLLIDSLALEGRVLQSPLAASMLRDLKPLGLVGLGILPGPLRRPLAATRALLRPGDFRGLRLAINESAVATAALRALGATADPIPSGGPIGGLDGVEQQVDSIYPNNYDLHARYLAGNVNLWPRPAVLFMTRKHFEALTPGERVVLGTAAKDALAPMVSLQRRRDAQAVTGLCRRGLIVADATPGDLAALTRAFIRVYAAADERTRSSVAAIQAMKDRLAEPADAVHSCPGGRPVPTVVVDGSYTVTITRDDALRAGLPPGNELARTSRQSFRLVLRAGNFTLLELHDRPPSVGFTGSFSVYRDRIVASGDNGDELNARLSLHGRALRFSDITVPGLPPVNQYSVVWGSHPWTRIQ